MTRRKWRLGWAVPSLVACGAVILLSIRWFVLPRIWLARTLRAAEAKDWLTADRYLARYMFLCGETTNALLTAAQIDATAGRSEDAVRSLSRVPRGSPEASQARFYLSRLLLDLNRAAEAERTAKESLEIDARATGPRRVLFEIYRWEARELEARELVEQVYDQAPPEVKPSLLSFLFTVDYGRYGSREAADRLKKFLAADPGDVDAMAALAALDAEASRLERARSQFERVLHLRPEHLAGRAALVQCCIQLGDFARVKELLDDWPSQQRDVRYTRAHGTYLHSALSNYAAAAAEFERVLQVMPDDWQIRHRLGECLISMGHAKRGEQEIARAAKLRQLLDRSRIARLLSEVLPDLSSADHRFQIGSFYEEMGYAKRAEEWYVQALAIAGDHQGSRDALERLHGNRVPSN